MSQPEKTKHLDALTAMLPKGRLFEAAMIEGSNFRQLLCGFSGELMDAQNYLLELEREYFPDNTTAFLTEWERALGLPNKCLGRGTTNEERRSDILLQLAAIGTQTIEDFKRLGDIFGIEISISDGSQNSSFCVAFPMLFFCNPSDARYTIVVQLPDENANGFCLTFCHEFGDVTQSALRCLLDQLKPANTRIVYPECS